MPWYNALVKKERQNTDLQITPKNKQALSRALLPFYTKERRVFPWREPRLVQHKDGSLDAYAIWVSEIMLQQTQASRVVLKYERFMRQFPTVKKLSQASLREVLIAWQGLGYNRRGKALHVASKILCEKHDCAVPREKEALLSLPGVGAYTAGAVRAFAFNEPELFLETNIRTVLLHHFLQKRKEVADKELLAHLEKVMDKKEPRRFYTAMMDYGAQLKAEGIHTNAQSKHYTKQKAFKGSDREIRGALLRALAKRSATTPALEKLLQSEPLRLKKQLIALQSEGFITKRKHSWVLQE